MSIVVDDFHNRFYRLVVAALNNSFNKWINCEQIQLICKAEENSVIKAWEYFFVFRQHSYQSTV